MAAFRNLRPQPFGLAAGLLLCGIAAASAQDRCEGTFCDLYYDHMAKSAQGQQAQPAQPPSRTAQPAQASDGLLGRLFSSGSPAPQQADAGTPPAKKPLVAVQGGGVVGLMQGRAPQRCTGTLCDFYYGGPPKEEPEAAGPAAVTPAAPTGRAAEAEYDGPAASTRGIEPRESVRNCAANPRDPWSCYR